MVSVSPEGLQRGVQAQGTHHAPKAGTQRPQKHIGANTLEIRVSGGGRARPCKGCVHVLSQQSKWMTFEKKLLAQGGSVCPAGVSVRACVAHRHVKGWPLAAPLAWGSVDAVVS